MKKILSVTLILAMVFALAACGGKGVDATGRYICVGYEDMLGEKHVGDGEYLELRSGGKGVMCLSNDPSDEGEVTWKLKGEKLTLVSLIFNFDGTVKDDVIEIEVMLTNYTFAKEGSDALKNLRNAAPPTETTDGDDEDEGNSGSSNIPADMLGLYDCTGWGLGDMIMDPAGEWINLETTTRGVLQIAGIEYPFDWSFDGETLTITEDVGPIFTATFEDGVISLDMGMTYLFEKGGAQATSGDADDADDAADDVDMSASDAGFVSTTTEIKIPSTWYGVIWSDDVEYEGDVWGMFAYDGAYPYFEIYESPELADGEFSAILSMYIIEDATIVIPDIGEDDAWFFERTLTSDDDYEFMSVLLDGALYFEGTAEYRGDSFDVSILLREDGAEWDEENDPLPPSYDAYKAGI